MPLERGAEVRLRKEIRELELESCIADLETDGYTVLPHGEADPIELFDELVTVIEELSIKLPIDNLEGNRLGKNLFHKLPECIAFETAFTAGAPLALVAYLLGYRVKRSRSIGLIKDSRASALGIHLDHSAK